MYVNLLTLAQQVAKELGPHFKAEGETNGAVIRQTNAEPEYGLILWRHHHGKQIRISGFYPQARDGREFPDSSKQADPIGVGEGREAKEIAAEINRRFLPNYVEIFERAIADRDDHNRYLDRQAAMANRFAKILHGTVSQSGDRVSGGPLSYAHHFGSGSLRDDLYINTGDGTVNIHLAGVPADLAEKILRTWLEGWRPECRKCHEYLDTNDICQNPECDRCGKNGLATKQNP